MLEPRAEYLYACIESDVDSYDIVLGHWQDIAAWLFERKLKRVLVHENIVAELSDAETFRLATEMRSIGFTNAKIAILDAHPSHQKSTDFGVLVGTNRGLRVRLFGTARDAERGLLVD